MAISRCPSTRSGWRSGTRPAPVNPGPFIFVGRSKGDAHRRLFGQRNACAAEGHEAFAFGTADWCLTIFEGLLDFRLTRGSLDQVNCPLGPCMGIRCEL